MTNVIDMTERLPHAALYVSCMECAEDWVAVAPKGVETGLECPACGAMAGERVRTGDLEWFNRYMAGPDQKKRTLVLLTLVLLNAGRMGL